MFRKLLWVIILLLMLMPMWVVPVLASSSSDVGLTAIPVSTTGGITGFTVTYINDNRMDMAWGFSGSAVNIMIRGKYGEFPTDIPNQNTTPSDGWLVYYGSGTLASDTSVDMNFNDSNTVSDTSDTPFTVYYKAWAQRANGTWFVTTSTGSEESKEMILIFLGFVTLTLTGFGVLGKKPFLDWASVPFWLITCIYIYMNYTWLAEAQWLFLLIGFAMSAGMVFEAILTQRKESLANLKEDDTLMNEDEENWTDEDVDKKSGEFKLTKVQKKYT